MSSVVAAVLGIVGLPRPNTFIISQGCDNLGQCPNEFEVFV